MKIAAITRFKNGALFSLLRKLDWTQTELARKTGIHLTTIGDYCNLRKVPGPEHKQRIQNAFAAVGEYLDIDLAWPEGLKPLGQSPTVVQVRDVELDALEYRQYLQLQNSPPAFSDIDQERLDEAISTLNERESEVVRLYFSDPKPTFDELGKRFNVTREYCRQILAKALRKIRRAYISTGWCPKTDPEHLQETYGLTSDEVKRILVKPPGLDYAAIIAKAKFNGVDFSDDVAHIQP